MNWLTEFRVCFKRALSNYSIFWRKKRCRVSRNVYNNWISGSFVKLLRCIFPKRAESGSDLGNLQDHWVGKLT